MSINFFNMIKITIEKEERYYSFLCSSIKKWGYLKLIEVDFGKNWKTTFKIVEQIQKFVPVTISEGKVYIRSKHIFDIEEI